LFAVEVRVDNLPDTEKIWNVSCCLITQFLFFYAPGGVIIVSHDERLIRETECQLWVIEDQASSRLKCRLSFFLA
jgi:hypothetical protein